MSSALAYQQLFSEIQEQPERLAVLLSNLSTQSLDPATVAWKTWVGCAEGSSLHALEIALPFIQQWTGRLCKVYSPDALLQQLTVGQCFGQTVQPLFSETGFLTVSQSGETASVRSVLTQLAEALPLSERLVAFTNAPASTLARLGQQHCFVAAGEERSIAATKSLTCSIMALLQWAVQLGKANGNLGAEPLKQAQQALAEVVQSVADVFQPDVTEHLQVFSEQLTQVDHFVLLSKGLLSRALPEIGLKLTETSTNIVYTDNTESFKHGPKVVLSPRSGICPNTVYFIPPDPQLADKLFQDIYQHFWKNQAHSEQACPLMERERIFFVRFAGGVLPPTELCQKLFVSTEQVLTLPQAPSNLSALFVAIVAFQWVSAHIAALKGENPNNISLSKAVTES